MKKVTKQFEENFNKALDLKNQGNIAEAINILEELTIERPDIAATFGMLGKILWDNGDMEKAIVSFEKATKVNPLSEKASLGLFHLLWEEDRKKEAIEEMQRYMKIATSEDYNEICNELVEKNLIKRN